MEGNFINRKRGRNVIINVDEYDLFFRKSKLNRDEIKYLLSKSYKIAKYKRLASNKKEEFLLKPRHNESLIHFFVVYDTANYLESKGIKVKKYTTKKPDLVFNLGKKSIAIEVETGGKIEKDRKVIIEKIKYLKENHDKWFFVVTDKTKTHKYKKLADSIDLRFLKQKITNLRRG